MPGNYIVVYRAAGTLITQAVYNDDHQNHIDARNAEKMGAYGISAAQFQATFDPFLDSTIHRPPSLAHEIMALRFTLQQIISALSGNSTSVNWYDRLNSPAFPVVGARVLRSSDISIPHATFTTLSFSGGTEDFNTNSVYDDMTQPTRFTAPLAGKYMAFAQVTWSSFPAIGQRFITISFPPANPGATSSNLAPTAAVQSQTVTGLFDMQIGDYVQFVVYQDSGGSLNLISATTSELGGSFPAAVGGLVFLGANF